MPGRDRTRVRRLRADANSAAGVPARSAQPEASGPGSSHATNPSGKSAAAPSADRRIGRCVGHPALTRAITAASTTTTHSPVSTSIQWAFGSVPVP